MAKSAENLPPEGRNGVDRRKLARVILRKPVTVRLHDNSAVEYSGICENASADGMLLLLDQRIPERSRLEVLLSLPAPERKENIRLCCSGQVLRVVPGAQAGSWSIAVEFFDRSITWGHVAP